MTLRICLPARPSRALILAAGAASVALCPLAAPPALAAAINPHHGHGAHDEHGAHGGDTITVSATRSRRRVQDDPIRVEIIDREEIEEKMIMAPGNISVLLAETGGLWVQASSAALGSAGIRVQGMSERYTLLLADGLPLYGGQAGSIGLLQIPPTDLARVEIIKGSASALYGGSAMGGVINLISRRPSDAREGEILFNATSQRGADVTAYTAAPLADGWSYSVTGGGHWQDARDLDGSGWADIPSYVRYTIRPRLFWDRAAGGGALFTFGYTQETRSGGTLPGRTVPDGNPFVQGLDTQRLDAGFNLDLPISEDLEFGVRASAMATDHRHQFGPRTERDQRRTLFGEATLAWSHDGHSLVGGLAVQADTLDADDFPDIDYSFTVPGVFIQYDRDLTEDFTVSGGLRADSHSAYGEFLSPRVSVLWRPGAWTLRASAARGFFAPGPFVGAIEETGLSRLDPLTGLEAERAESLSFDIGRRFGPFEANLIAFRTRVTDEAVLIPTGATLPDGTDRLRIVNAPGETVTRGGEALLRYRYEHYVVTASYMYTQSDARDPVTGQRVETPLTPRHSAGMVAMWEDHDRGRIGFEAYYTGGQTLDDNPYRTRSRPFVNMGILAEWRVGRFSVFGNAENILNIRQSRYDPLVRPALGSDGRWTVDAWAPTDGFVFNGGVRVRFGAEQD
ncbi:MAG: TonB-dependent receptor plug domain-containing protein [Oceanicaulis sp.]